MIYNFEVYESTNVPSMLEDPNIVFDSRSRTPTSRRFITIYADGDYYLFLDTRICKLV